MKFLCRLRFEVSPKELWCWLYLIIYSGVTECPALRNDWQIDEVLSSCTLQITLLLQSFVCEVFQSSFVSQEWLCYSSWALK